MKDEVREGRGKKGEEGKRWKKERSQCLKLAFNDEEADRDLTSISEIHHPSSLYKEKERGIHLHDQRYCKD